VLLLLFVSVLLLFVSVLLLFVSVLLLFVSVLLLFVSVLLLFQLLAVDRLFINRSWIGKGISLGSRRWGERGINKHFHYYYYNNCY
jgi:hypothetical protein